MLSGQNLTAVRNAVTPHDDNNRVPFRIAASAACFHVTLATNGQWKQPADGNFPVIL